MYVYCLFQIKSKAENTVRDITRENSQTVLVLPENDINMESLPVQHMTAAWNDFMENDLTFIFQMLCFILQLNDTGACNRFTTVYSICQLLWKSCRAAILSDLFT